MADLSVRYLPVDSLIPYARNSRTHSDAQVAQIAASIREFGFTNPVLVDADGGIIAGHGRVLAARKLKLDAVPTIALGHLTQTKRRAYVIADNKLAEAAGWDEGLLAAELAALESDGFEVKATGFSDDEVAALLDRLDAGVDAVTVDAAAATRQSAEHLELDDRPKATVFPLVLSLNRRLYELWQERKGELDVDDITLLAMLLGEG